MPRGGEEGGEGKVVDGERTLARSRLPLRNSITVCTGTFGLDA